MAAILYPDTGAQDLASLLELDPHGVSDFSAAQPNPAREGLGVHRGDFVLIHRPGTTNGLEKPRVPFIGESEIWVRETPVSVDGKLTGWRRAMSELGASIASRRGLDNSEGQLRRLSKDDSSLSWFGEVTEVVLFSVPVSLLTWTFVISYAWTGQ
jgi:ubiquitin-conjugating enzyme E2 O